MNDPRFYVLKNWLIVTLWKHSPLQTGDGLNRIRMHRIWTFAPNWHPRSFPLPRRSCARGLRLCLLERTTSAHAPTWRFLPTPRPLSLLRSWTWLVSLRLNLTCLLPWLPLPPGGEHPQATEAASVSGETVPASNYGAQVESPPSFFFAGTTKPYLST